MESWFQIWISSVDEVESRTGVKLALIDGKIDHIFYRYKVDKSNQICFTLVSHNTIKEKEMLNVLLVKLESLCNRRSLSVLLTEDNEYDALVLEGRVPLLVQREYYQSSDSVNDEVFKEKIKEINDSFEIEFGGQVLAIDKYPISSDPRGVKKTDYSGLSRYTTEFSFDISSYDLIILLCPDFKRIVLSELNFAYYGSAYIDGSGRIVFSNETVLSVKTFWEEYKGIPLQQYNQLALDPNNPNEYYALRFEEKQIPEAVINKLL